MPCSESRVTIKTVVSVFVAISSIVARSKCNLVLQNASMNRRVAVRALNAVLLLSLLGLVLLFLNSPSSPPELNLPDRHPPLHPPPERDDSPGIVANTPSELIKGVMPKAIDVKKSVEFNNANTGILNLDKFGAITGNEIVIVVQVHDRVKYLEILVGTLATVRGIDSALLVFSHDFNDPEINAIVRNIRFCRVMQIFYPYSIQLFPDEFPGQDPADCPPDTSRAEAERIRCANWRMPDKYGHYRVARLTQLKHHWWWKMNYVFDAIVERYAMVGWVLLLEDDHFVVDDGLHVLKKIIAEKEKLCAKCQVISLGFYLKQFGSYGQSISNLAVYPWFSSRHNMGMTINKHTWALVKNCSQLFCTYDDYNWDWSLMKVNMACLPERLHVIYAKSPRVLHVGDCGVHTHRCEADVAAERARQLVARHRDALFPQALQVTEVSRRMLKPSKENGGWGDTRDHDLCLNNSRLVLV